MSTIDEITKAAKALGYEITLTELPEHFFSLHLDSGYSERYSESYKVKIYLEDESKEVLLFIKEPHENGGFVGEIEFFSKTRLTEYEFEIFQKQLKLMNKELSSGYLISPDSLDSQIILTEDTQKKKGLLFSKPLLELLGLKAS